MLKIRRSFRFHSVYLMNEKNKEFYFVFFIKRFLFNEIPINLGKKCEIKRFVIWEKKCFLF
jgi:hypothetical protein